MRVIARNSLVARGALEPWFKLVRAAHWTSTYEVQRAAPKSKVLNRKRVRFEVAGGNYGLVAAFEALGETIRPPREAHRPTNAAS
jgi:mRNA interferase HigB